MNPTTIVIDGEPHSWKRAGRSRFGSYVTADEADARSRIVWEYKAQGGPFIDEGPVFISIVAVTALPKSARKSVKEAVRDGQRVYAPKMRKDWDNIAKTIGDALKGVAFRDDAQICDGHVLKVYGVRAYTSITISVPA